MLGRLKLSADFERVLAVPPRSRSAHFAVHHVAARPTSPGKGRKSTGSGDLSTGIAPVFPQSVDESPGGWWLGTVVPKRHARRSVTRSLIKRQMRNVLQTHLGDPARTLPPGLWVVRLRAPFDPKAWPAAASPALRAAARSELEKLFARAAAA